MTSIASPQPVDNPLARNFIPLDPDGNLLIICKHPKKPSPFHFLVSSKILSLASPVFASLFQDPVSHNEQYQLVLDDDHPEPVGTLLELCHFGRNSPLPPAQLKGINALAELSQKYGISTLMVPWITAWSQPLHENDKLNFGRGNDLKQWLRISCVYNQKALFNKVTKQAVLTGSAESLDVSESPEAPYNNIIAQIALERIEVLGKIIAIALTLLNQYQTTDLTCKQPADSNRCDATLLGSVLKGLMALGVYQPIPVAPYLGMTVIGVIEGIKNLPLMADPSHTETCGEEIKKNINEVLMLAHEVSGHVKGLELKDFTGNKQEGQVQGLVLTVVGKKVVQKWPQKHTTGNFDKKRGKGDEGEGKVKVEIQEEDVGGEREGRQLSNEENGNRIDKEEADTVNLNDISGGNFFLSTPINTPIPAGVTTESLENLETSENFEIPGLPEDGRTVGAVEEGVGVKEVEGVEMGVGVEVEVEEEGRDVGEAGDSKEYHPTRGHELEIKQEYSINSESKELLMLKVKGYTPTKNQNKLSTPSSGKEEITPLQELHTTKHSTSRANAEAHGHRWSTPGSELVQKYQRGPRFPFHPEVTVGDISDEEHTVEIKRLKDLFPQVDTKILLEFLRRGNWNSQDAVRMLCAGGISMDPVNEVDSELTPVPNFPTLEPTIISPLGSEPIIYQELEQKLIALPKAPSSTSTVKAPVPKVLSISRLVAGKLNTEQTEARFWPAPDRAVVMRSLALSENKKAIKRLLAMFPQASADKGFIDVLYRSGWDIEEAARRLEGLGLVRQLDSGDGEKAKSKGIESEINHE